MRADPATQERMIDGLRGSLLGAKDDTERCKIELLAVATAHSRGDQAAAQKEIERRSLKPYSECEPENREAKSKNIWYKYGGFAAIGIALISLVFTVIDYARQKVGEARRERSTRAAESRRRREEDEGDGAADPMDAYPDPRTRAGPDDG
jgi:hypothetical protein